MKHIFCAAFMALLGIARVSGQCVSVSYVNWYPCGVSTTNSPLSCDRAYMGFSIRQQTDVSVGVWLGVRSRNYHPSFIFILLASRKSLSSSHKS